MTDAASKQPADATAPANPLGIAGIEYVEYATHEPQAFGAPEGYEVTIVPLGELRFTLRPWPLSVGQFQWPVKARRVPVGRYASREALAATPSEPVELLFEVAAET